MIPSVQNSYCHVAPAFPKLPTPGIYKALIKIPIEGTVHNG